MPRPKPTSRLYPGPRRWIFDALKVNNRPKKMTKTSETTKRISFPRILLSMHHQLGSKALRHILKRTRTVVLVDKDPDNRAKARILLLLASMLLLSGKTRTKIRTRKTSPTLSATLVSKKTITLTSALRKRQKTSAGLDNLHVND